MGTSYLREQRLVMSLAVLVAVVLVLAGGPASAAGLTKAKVRQVVAKVLRTEAPKLSVAHAATAGTSDRADVADVADVAEVAEVAEVAGDAQRLGGSEPTAFLDRVAYSYTSDHSTVGGSPLPVVRSVSIAVPSGVAAVRVTGVSGFVSQEDASVALYVGINSTCLGSGPYTALSYGLASPNGGSVSIDRVVRVSAATYTFTLCAQAARQAEIRNPSFVVETVAVVNAG